MKTKKIVMAMAIMAATAFSATAQNPASENCDNKECAKKECSDKNKKCRADFAFEGIALTTEQQTAIKKLNEERMDKVKEARKSKGQADSLARMARRQEAFDYLHAVQKILTPEQYITYLENSVVNSRGQGKMISRDFKKGKDFRNAKDFKKNKDFGKGKDMKKDRADKKKK